LTDLPEDNFQAEEFVFAEVDASAITALFADKTPTRETHAATGSLVELSDEDDDNRPQPAFGALADVQAPSTREAPNVFTPLTREEQRRDDDDLPPIPGRRTAPPPSPVDVDEFPQDDYASGEKKLSRQDRWAIAKHDLGESKVPAAAPTTVSAAASAPAPTVTEPKLSLREWRAERRAQAQADKETATSGTALDDAATEPADEPLIDLNESEALSSRLSLRARLRARVVDSGDGNDEAEAAPTVEPKLSIREWRASRAQAQADKEAESAETAADAASALPVDEPLIHLSEAEVETPSARLSLRERIAPRNREQTAAAPPAPTPAPVSAPVVAPADLTVASAEATDAPAPAPAVDIPIEELPVFAVPTHNEAPPMFAASTDSASATSPAEHDERPRSRLAAARDFLAERRAGAGAGAGATSPNVAFAGVDASAPSMLEKARERLRPAPTPAVRASRFAELLTPLSRAEITLLQQDTQQNTPLFVALKRTRQQSLTRHQLGFIVGILATVWFFIKVGSNYPTALTNAARAYHPTWLHHLNGNEQTLFNGVWIGFGLLLPLLAGFILAEAINYVWRGLSDWRFDDLLLGVVACICAVAIYRLLIVNDSAIAALVFLVAWGLIRSFARVLTHLTKGRGR
jgi:hypothetical protein